MIKGWGLTYCYEIEVVQKLAEMAWWKEMECIDVGSEGCLGWYGDLGECIGVDGWKRLEWVLRQNEFIG